MEDSYYQENQHHQQHHQRHTDAYAEEFEDEYGGVSSSRKSSAVKQMSISDDAHHQQQQLLDDEQKAIEDEYQDEFDIDRTLGSSVKHHDIGGYMKKQESIMEDDPELKQLEEQQNLKNQKMQQEIQQQHEMDMLEADIGKKKSVTISEDEPIVHEKPREKRTARQRWHWAYNRIVHQQQVSQILSFKFK